jgi:hypothetical protein
MVYIVVGPGIDLCRSQQSTPNGPPVGESDMKKADVASIVLLILVLSFAVVIVDERWLRVAIAFVPALLLAQQGIRAADRGEEESASGWADRRTDPQMRDSVDELLRHIREFYLTCHMMGTGKLSPDDAVEKAAQQELQLNRLLARVTDGAKTRAAR